MYDKTIEAENVLFKNLSFTPENSDLWRSCVKQNQSQTVVKVVKKSLRTIATGEKRHQYRTGLNFKYKESGDLQSKKCVGRLTEGKLLGNFVKNWQNNSFC